MTEPDEAERPWEPLHAAGFPTMPDADRQVEHDDEEYPR